MRSERVALVELYEEPEKPQDGMEYLKRMMLNTSISAPDDGGRELDQLKQENDELK